VLKLGDFGNSVRLSESVTVKGELCDWVGTPAYMAPEVGAHAARDQHRLLRCVGAAVSRQWRGRLYGRRVHCPETRRRC
jgi:serine/threonine protein kinase